MPWHRHRLFCVSGSPAEHEDGRNSEPHEDHGRHGEVNIRPAGLRTPRRQGAEADRSPRCRHTRRQPDWKQPERRTQRLHHACGRQEDSHADHLGYHERRGGRQPQLSRKPGLMVGGLRAARMLDHELTLISRLVMTGRTRVPRADMLRAVKSWRTRPVTSCPRQPASRSRKQANTRRLSSYIIKTSSAVSPAARTPRVPTRVKLSFP